jgi:serine protease Do
MIQFLRISLVLLVVGIPTALGCAQKKVEVYSYSSDRNRGWLGVEVQDVTPKLEKNKGLTVHEGAYVAEVIEDSPAEKAGIQEGDVIVKFDGKDIDDSDDLIRAVQKTKPKTDVAIEFYRKSDKKSLTVTLGKKPRSRDFTFITPPDVPEPNVHPFQFHFFSQNEMFGLKLQTLNKQLAEYFEVPDKKGILVTEVKKNSSASEAGFKAGDVIINVDNERIEDTEDLMETLQEKDSDKESEFEVIRKGKSTILKMKLENEDDEDFSSLESLPYIEKLERTPFHQQLLDNHLEKLHDKMEMLKEKIERNKVKFHRKLQHQFKRLQIKT